MFAHVAVGVLRATRSKSARYVVRAARRGRSPRCAPAMTGRALQGRPLGERAETLLVQKGELFERQLAPALERPIPLRSAARCARGCRGKPPGTRRTRRDAPPPLREPRGSRRAARWSDTRCSGADSSTNARSNAPVGHASRQSVQLPHRSGIDTSGSSTSVVTTSPSSTNDPQPGTMSSPFFPMNPRPARAAQARSSTGASSVIGRARSPRRACAGTPRACGPDAADGCGSRPPVRSGRCGPRCRDRPPRVPRPRSSRPRKRCCAPLRGWRRYRAAGAPPGRRRGSPSRRVCRPR